MTRPDRTRIAGGVLALMLAAGALSACGSSDSASQRTSSDGITAPDASDPGGYSDEIDDWEATSTTTTEHQVDSVAVKWSYVDDDGWHYEGSFDARLPKLTFTTDITEAPPGRARLMVQYDGPIEELTETVEPVDEGRQGPTLTLVRGFLEYPFSEDLEDLGGEHSGIGESTLGEATTGQRYAPCFHALVPSLDGDQRAVLICNPGDAEGGASLALGVALGPIDRSGEPVPAMRYDQDEAGLDPAVRLLNNTDPGYIVENPDTFCPDFVISEGTATPSGDVSTDSADECTFKVEIVG